MTETGQGILIGTVFVFLACLVIPAFGILAALVVLQVVAAASSCIPSLMVVYRQRRTTKVDLLIRVIFGSTPTLVGCGFMTAAFGFLLVIARL